VKREDGEEKEETDSSKRVNTENEEEKEKGVETSKSRDGEVEATEAKAEAMQKPTKDSVLDTLSAMLLGDSKATKPKEGAKRRDASPKKGTSKKEKDSKVKNEVKGVFGEEGGEEEGDEISQMVEMLRSTRTQAQAGGMNDKERRENAIKATMQMMAMFGLDDEGEEDSDEEL